MENKVLVAYTTNAGSTADVANAIGQTLGQAGAQVDVRQIKEVAEVSAYDAVVVGGPMILGWHRQARKFLKRHQKALSQVPVAFFMTALKLTQTTETALDSLPIFQDPRLAKPPQNPDKLSFKERFTTAQHYLGSVLKTAPQVKPVGVAFFAGKLDYGKLNIFQMLFVMLIIGATPGDFRNWDTIRDWAVSLRPALLEAQE
jgi:menaquinone-dependent protoporphyrinogen IX oxidase